MQINPTLTSLLPAGCNIQQPIAIHIGHAHPISPLTLLVDTMNLPVLGIRMNSQAC